MDGRARSGRLRRGLAASGLAVLGLSCAAAETAGGAFGTAPVLPQWLAAFDVDVTISAESIEWQGAELRNAEIPLRVHQGTLSIAHAHAEVAGGSVELDAEHQPSSTTSVLLQGHEVELGQLKRLRPYFQGVPVNLTLDLLATGAHPRALAATAHGRIRLRNTAPGSIPKSVERAGATLLGSLFKAFAPIRGEDEVTIMECLALDLPVDNGVIQGKHVMELRTQRVNIYGGGTIDLTQERLDLRLTPEARRGIEIKSLKVVKAILVQGNFAAPLVTIDGGDLIGRAATLGFDVAGGVVIGALTSNKSRTSLCDGALLPPPSPAGRL